MLNIYRVYFLPFRDKSTKLPIVGSPYWMAPETLNGLWYGPQVGEKKETFYMFWNIIFMYHTLAYSSLLILIIWILNIL